MIRARRPRRPTRVFVMRPRRNTITYDYLVTNDAEWTSTFALGAATLSGKTIAVDGVLSPTIAISNFNPASNVTIIGFPNAEINRLELTTCGNLTFKNLLFQARGWPGVTPVSMAASSTFGQLNFEGCTFRHGYGPLQLDLDPLATYPEYSKVSNVTTATTTSSRIPLSFQDAASTSAWVTFTNNGSATVYFNIGNSSVTASAANTAVAAGASVRSASFNPQTSTHIAVISASGSQSVNAVTEIGLGEYLVGSVGSTSTTTCSGMTFKNCVFSDLNNGLKGLPNWSSGAVFVVMDCTFRRIYQDNLAGFGDTAFGAAYIMRNTFEINIADTTNDARDPHGDIVQLYGSGSSTLGPVYLAGNVSLRPPRRAGITSQGLFFSDNAITPSFDRIVSVGDVYIGGMANGFHVGENTNYARRVFAYGCTVMNPASVDSSNGGFRLNQDSNSEMSIMESVTSVVDNVGVGTIQQQGNVILPNTASPAACLPNLANVFTATNRSQLYTALTGAAEATGKGATAHQNKIDWNTTDHTQVIKWDSLPSGVIWTDLFDQTPSSVVTLPLRRVLNERANQSVVPAAGTEWRSVDTNGSTEVQAWTSSSGTIQPQQYIQTRVTSGTAGNTVVSSVSINGFACSANVTSTPAFAGRGAYFDGSASFSGTAVSGITGSNDGMCSFWFRTPTTWPASLVTLIDARTSGGARLFRVELPSTNQITFRLDQDGSGSDTFSTPSGALAANTWYHALAAWSWSASRFQVYINNVSQSTAAYSFSGATKFDMNGVSIPRIGIGCLVGRTSIYTGDIGHLYLNFSETLDLSVAANREKFALAGVPVNLGDNGQLVTGTAPHLYYDGVPPSWINRGTATGGPILSGSLSASSGSPSY